MTTLWNKAPSGAEITIPILGLCGEFESGKTIFAATIAPGKHPAGHRFAGKARTLMIDLEKSSENYAGSSLGFDRIDLAERVLNTPGKSNCEPIDMYEGFRKVIPTIMDEQYDIIAVDPVTDIDSGMTEYVKRNCTKFGLTTKQLEKSSGLLWGVVKDQWNILLLQLAAKCKTFVFTAHMRDVYVGNTPSGKREPKGKETLAKLCTLYIELQRKAVKGVIPKVPTGIRLKGRLSDIHFNPATGEIETIELLPKVIENCTPKRIRELIASPLAVGPEFKDEHLSDDMKLAFQLALETQRNEANNAELEILERRNQLMGGLATQSSPAVDKSDPAVSGSNARDGQAIAEVFKKSPEIQLIPTDAPASPPVSGFVAASTFGQSKPQADPVPAPNEPPTPEPQAAAATPEEKAEEPPFVVDAPTNAEQFTSNTDLVHFPGPTNSREESIELLKKGKADGLITADDLNEVIRINKVGKVSELTESSLDNVVTTFLKVAEIVKAADERGIPRGKLSEFVAIRKEPSLFLSSVETKNAILETIKQVPVKN